MTSFVRVSAIELLERLPVLYRERAASAEKYSEELITAEIPKAFFKRNRTREKAIKRLCESHWGEYNWICSQEYRWNTYCKEMVNLAAKASDGLVTLGRKDVNIIFGKGCL